MSYTLEQFSADIRSALQGNPGANGRRKVCQFVSKALVDKAFVERHLTSEQCRPRKVLFEDPDLGFCICGHVYEHGKSEVWPHDHGTSWAIYGLAEGRTEMTEWQVVRDGDETNPTLVEPLRSYEIKRGHCHLYEVGDIHSPIIGVGSKLIRIEGENLDKVRRSNIKAA